MRNYPRMKLSTTFLVLLMALPLQLPAQEIQSGAIGPWYSLDTEFRQAIIDEVKARRGLEGGEESAFKLIRTAEDVREILHVSCELSGACAYEGGLATLGNQLKALPDYDEQQGRRNAKTILMMKVGHE